MELTQLHRALEAILFASGERVETKRLSEVLERDAKEVEAACLELADDYAFQRRGVRILKLDNGFQMVSSGASVGVVSATGLSVSVSVVRSALTSARKVSMLLPCLGNQCMTSP